MFVRRVQTRPHGAAGGTAYRLVHSQRCGAKVRQIVLAHFPAGLDRRVPRPHWKRLAAAVRDQLTGQRPLPDPDPDPAERELAERIAAEASAVAPLVRRRLRDGDCDLGFQIADDPAPAPREQALALLPSSLRQTDVREAGAARLLDLLAGQLGLRECLQQAGLRPRHVRLGCAQILARALHPASERETLRWLQHDSALPELLGLRPADLSSNSLYLASDALWQARDQIEPTLFAHESKLFRLEPRIIFYDLTNTFHTGRPKHPYAARGRSKQKRHDCPLVTLGLLLDGQGFPRRSEVLAGNVGEPGTLQEAVRRLGALAGERPTVVFDGGIVRAENLAWLREQGLHWITVERPRRAAPERAADTQWQSAGGHQLQIWRLSTAEAGLAAGAAAERPEADPGEEARLCVWSPQRERDEQDFLQRRRARYEACLQALHTGLSVKGHLKAYAKVLRKLGRLEQTHKLVASQYKVRVERGEKGRAKAVLWELGPRHGQRDRVQGTSLLRTSRTDWDDERIVREYCRLADIEATFRSFKEELGLRPLHHSLGQRVAGHLFITVLAYHLVHALRYRLRAAGVTYSWHSIRARMRTWVRLTTTMRTAEGQTWSQRQDVDPNNEQARLAAAAGLAFQRHRRTIPLDWDALREQSGDIAKDHKV